MAHFGQAATAAETRCEGRMQAYGEGEARRKALNLTDEHEGLGAHIETPTRDDSREENRAVRRHATPGNGQLGPRCSCARHAHAADPTPHWTHHSCRRRASAGCDHGAAVDRSATLQTCAQAFTLRHWCGRARARPWRGASHWKASHCSARRPIRLPGLTAQRATEGRDGPNLRRWPKLSRDMNTRSSRNKIPQHDTFKRSQEVPDHRDGGCLPQGVGRSMCHACVAIPPADVAGLAQEPAAPRGAMRPLAAPCRLR